VNSTVRVRIAEFTVFSSEPNALVYMCMEIEISGNEAISAIIFLHLLSLRQDLPIFHNAPFKCSINIIFIFKTLMT
jgi:hypothetical protein